MDADKLKTMLDEQTPAIVAQVRENVVKAIASDYEHKIAALCYAEIEAHFKAEIAPQIVKALQGDNALIVEAVKQAAAQIAAKLAEKMVEHAAAKMEKSYDFRKIAETLFGYY